MADSAVILKSSFDCFTVAESSGFHFNLFGKIKFGTFLYSAVSKLIMEKNGEELNFHAKSLALLAMPGLFFFGTSQRRSEFDWKRENEKCFFKM